MSLALPLVEELPAALDAVGAFVRLCHFPHAVFLDSALRHRELGRYSFVAADPFDSLSAPAGVAQPFDKLAEALGGYAAPTMPGLPPLQGGAIGLLGYDLNRSLERIPAPRYDEFQVPALAIGLYDVVLAFDHLAERGWIISHGFPASQPEARHERARQRMDQFLELLQATPKTNERPWPQHEQPLLDVAQLAPHYPVGEEVGLVSNFDRDSYLQAVATAVEYIRAGDIFQVNLAQRLLHPAEGDSVSLYLRLRERNPATFAGYLDLGPYQIVSASPERFVSLRDGLVETRPIKGTRGRWLRPVADLFAAHDLQQSEKDRAENVMIVDLLRNDLACVCDPDSVEVTQLCGLETYQFVQHLVSVVQGRLADGRRPVDLLAAAFPGGSITGAPKVRAMEIIAELEPTARGPYCGCLGYLGFDGTMDWNILIRTITAGRGWWQLPVGGGIVAQSEPEREYDETWQKARGLIRALKSEALPSSL